MPKLPNKYRSGYGETDPDINSFLKPSNTDYYEAQASGHGYNARWSDDYNDARSAVGFSQDDPSFRSASWTGDRDDVHQRLGGLVDGQEDQPAGKLLGGGGPVSDNKRGGVGAGKPRFAPKGPSFQVPKGSKGGI